MVTVCATLVICTSSKGARPPDWETLIIQLAMYVFSARVYE